MGSVVVCNGIYGGPSPHTQPPTLSLILTRSRVNGDDDKKRVKTEICFVCEEQWQWRGTRKRIENRKKRESNAYCCCCCCNVMGYKFSLALYLMRRLYIRHTMCSFVRSPSLRPSLRLWSSFVCRFFRRCNSALLRIDSRSTLDVAFGALIGNSWSIFVFSFSVGWTCPLRYWLPQDVPYAFTCNILAQDGDKSNVHVTNEPTDRPTEWHK